MSIPFHGDELPMVVPVGDRFVTLFGVLVDGDRVSIDNGALHSRSAAEANIRFSDDERGRGKGRRVLVAWVAGEGEPSEPRGLIGLTLSEMWIDAESGSGYKRLSTHTYAMTRAMRGKCDTSLLDAKQAAALGDLLRGLGVALSDDVRKALSGSTGFGTGSFQLH